MATIPGTAKNGHAFIANSLHDNSRAHFGNVINYSYAYYSSTPTNSIGVIASIGGLQAQMTALHARLKQHMSAVTSQSQVAERMLGQLSSGMELINAIRTQVDHHDEERAWYIQGDDLITSLTNCILILSSLHTTLENALADENSCLHDNTSILHAETLVQVTQDLQRQNDMWRVMQEILGCSSEFNAYTAGARFENIVTGLLHSKPDLAYRLESVEQQLEAILRRLDEHETSPERTSIPDIQHHTVPERHESHTIDTTQRLNDRESFITEYQLVLAQSGVYRKHERRSELFSMQSSARRSYVWSELTKFTMTSLSILSVIALPIRLSELADNQWYRVETNVARPSFGAEDAAADDISKEQHRRLDATSEEKGLGLVTASGIMPRLREEKEYEPRADAIRGAAGIIRALSIARSKREADEAKRIHEERLEPIGENEIAEWDGLRRRRTTSAKEQNYEPRSDMIRRGARIGCALDTLRTEREEEEAGLIRKERLELIGENETVEWDGLRRRKTVRGSIRRTEPIHPPLGMSHFPDWDDESESDSEVHPGFFGRIGRIDRQRQREHSPVPLESVQMDKSDPQNPYGLPEGLRRVHIDDRADSQNSSLAPPKPYGAGGTRRQFSFQNVFSRKKSQPDTQTHYGLPETLRREDDGYSDTPDDGYSDDRAESLSSSLAPLKHHDAGRRRQFSFQNVFSRNESESDTQTHYGLPESLEREDDEYSDSPDDPA